MPFSARVSEGSHKNKNGSGLTETPRSFLFHPVLGVISIWRDYVPGHVLILSEAIWTFT